MVSSLVPVQGLVEVELGIQGLTCSSARLWVVKCMHDKATNLFIGSFLKLIYAEADYTKLEQWPTPWRQLYNWSSWGYWYNGPNLTFEEDSDLDFHILFLCLFLPIHLLCSLFILVLVYSSLFLCGAWTFFYEVIHPYTAILGVAFAFLQLFKILFSRR